jgi:hypothetical protein
MARISNYKQDTELTASDRLVGSSYEGDGQTGPVYKTRTYTLGELNSFFSNTAVENSTITENSEAIAQARTELDAITDELSAIAYFLVDISSSYTTYTPGGGDITSISEAFANLVIQTTTSDRFATSQYVLDLFSSIGTFDENGNLITSNAFITNIIEAISTDGFATTQYVLNLGSNFGTYDADGNLVTLSESFADLVLSTANTASFATATFATNLASSFGTYDANGNITSLSQSFADQVISTANMAGFASADYVLALASSIGNINASGTVTSVSESFANLMLNTTAMDDKAEASYVLNLAGSIGTFDVDGNLVSYSTSFINNIASLVNTGSYALASDLTQLQSQIGTFDANGNLLTVNNSFATTLLQTTAGQGLAEATFVNNLGSSIGTLDANGNLTAVSNAFATSVLGTSAGLTKADVTYVDTRIAAIGTYDTNTNTFSSFDAGFISDISASVNTSGFAIATDVDAQFAQVANFDGSGNFTSFSTAATNAITSTITSETQSEVDFVSNLTAVIGATRTGNDAELDPTVVQAEATVDARNTSTTPNSIISGELTGGVAITLTASNTSIQVGQYVEIDSVPNGVPYMADQYSRVASIVSGTQILLTDGMYIPDGSTIRFRGSNTVDVTVSTGTIRPGFLIKSTSTSHTDVIGTYVTVVNGGALTLSKAEDFTQAEALEFLGVYAAISETANAVANVDGTFRSSYGLQVDANGNVTGMRFLADSTGTEIVFNTDSFKVVNSDTGTTSTAPFEIVTGGDNPGLNLNIPLNGVSGSFSGDISASSGTFGGVTIDSNGLSFGTVTIDSTGITSNQFNLDATTGNATFAGSLSGASITGASGTFGGVTIDANGITTGNILINSTGISSNTFTLDATTGNATFSGTLSGANITGATGNFAGTLNGANITGATGTFTDTIQIGSGVGQIIIDDQGLRVASGNFAINQDGTADFSGNIDVGGITINGEGLDFGYTGTGNTLPLEWKNAAGEVVADIQAKSLNLFPQLQLNAVNEIEFNSKNFDVNLTGSANFDMGSFLNFGAENTLFRSFQDDNTIFSQVQVGTQADPFTEVYITTMQRATGSGGSIQFTCTETGAPQAGSFYASSSFFMNCLYNRQTAPQHYFVAHSASVPKFQYQFETSGGEFNVGLSSDPADRVYFYTNYYNVYLKTATFGFNGFNIYAQDGTRILTVQDNKTTTVIDLDVTGTFSNQSDASLKENIVEFNKPINANWKQFNMKNNPDQLRYGVIAQELEVEHPEFVSENNGIKSVNYIDLLVAKIAELENRIKELESKQNI